MVVFCVFGNTKELNKGTYSKVMCQFLLFRVAKTEDNPPWPTQALALQSDPGMSTLGAAEASKEQEGRRRKQAPTPPPPVHKQPCQQTLQQRTWTQQSERLVRMSPVRTNGRYWMMLKLSKRQKTSEVEPPLNVYLEMCEAEAQAAEGVQRVDKFIPQERIYIYMLES